MKLKVFFPISKDLVKIFASEVPSQKTIYDAVDFFKKEIFPKKKFKKFEKKIKDILLRNIINLHDEEGIDKEKIKILLKEIKNGKDILCSGLPNIKLVKMKKELILFDGHHSLLAYILGGKKYLKEIPHLVVENKKEDKIKVFFGEHASKLKNKIWRNYVINWYSKKQLCKRKRKNIGELFDAIKPFLIRESVIEN